MLIEVEIKGESALLQHRFGEQAQESTKQSTRKIQIQDETPRDAAEKAAYRLANGDLYLPGAAIARLIREAGGQHKQRGSRKSLKFIIPAAVLITEDTIPLHNGTPSKRLREYEVDSRPVTIPATKGRVMRHRPRLDEWGATFVLSINETILDEKTVHLLLEEGGRQIGVGDFRPEKGGPFGRFAIVRWEHK